MNPSVRSTLREARQDYFNVNALGDGGYDDRWVVLWAGPIPLVFPNSRSRVAALRLHDCHHPLTGYATSWLGETEIAAWEIASGCARFLAAWILNLYAMGLGLVLGPKRALRAWMRGQISTNLYHRGLDEPTLDRIVETLREEFGLLDEPPTPTLKDRFRWLAWSVTGLVLLLVSWTGPTLLLVWLFLPWLRG